MLFKTRKYFITDLARFNLNSFSYLLSLVLLLGILLTVLNNNLNDLFPDRVLAQSSLTATANNNTDTKVSLTLDYAHFIPLSTAQGNQVKALVNYTVQQDNYSIVGRPINGVMKVYNTLDRTLIRTSAFPAGFIANSSGTEQFATTLTDNSVQNVTAVIQFTNAARTVPISNPIVAELDYGFMNSTIYT